VGGQRPQSWQLGCKLARRCGMPAAKMISVLASNRDLAAMSAGPAISSFSHKPSRNLFQWTPIVVCLVDFSILEICYRELIAGRRVIAHSCKAERFQIEQVTGVFLSRPL
jgi:hypothetical protein